jgi:type II secretory pathway component PulF
MTGNQYETLLLVAQAVKSGLPFSEAIRLTIGEQADRNNRKLLHLADLLDQGVDPREAVKRVNLPAAIDNLLGVALNSENFPETFDELAEMEISRSLVIHRVLLALTYPFLLFLSSIITVFILVTITVPQFEAIFVDFETNLPLMTSLLIQMSKWATDGACLSVLVVLFIVLWGGMRFFFPRFWFCVPVLGNILRSLYSIRLLKQLAGMVRRNVPLPDALERCSQTMRNGAYRKDCRCAAADARNGVPLPEIVIQHYWLFPAWLAPVIAADGSPDILAKSLIHAAETVDQQKDTSLLFLQTLSLPLFLMFTFEIIGFVVISLFMPLISLITTLSG